MALGFTTYSEAAYAQSSVINNVIVIPSGVQATGAIGNVGVTSAELVIPTGVQATGVLGQVLGRAGFVFAKPRSNETFAITVQSTGSGNKYYVNDFRQLMPTALHKGFTYKFDQSDSSNNNHPMRFSTTPDGSHANDETFTITVQNVNGANKYFVNGVQQQMPFALKKGSTYKFDQSNTSNNNHPLRFSTTDNGSWAGGSEYTNGVTVVGTPGQSGAYTQIVVANNTPSQLYTYCLNHSGMGFGVSITAGVEYTDGVTVVGTPGQSGAYTQIVVASNAPSQLYTYCINHSGMGFGVSVKANVEIKSIGAVGDAIPSISINALPTGVQATGAIGTVSVSLSAVAIVTGVSASVSTANVLVWSEINTTQNPNWVEIAA